MTSNEIREKFLRFMEEGGHVRVPSSSLVPENDDSVLFTTAGMQQFKPYYTGNKSAESDFGSLNTTSSQKCIRTSDIDEVGDETHLTFFEMLGNFSFGGYWKREAIGYAYDFITKEMGLTIDYVSVFEGDSETPADTESEEIWKSIDPNIEVRRFNREENFWGPTGEEGPCGPTTEIYVNDVEVWNIVFNEFYCDKDKNYKPLETKGIDTGMGLERLVVQAQGKQNVFETDLFEQVLKSVRDGDERSRRIVADHIKAAVFMVYDGVQVSNTDRGYILRRLIRRAVRESDKLGMDTAEFGYVIDAVFDTYKDVFNEMLARAEEVRSDIMAEEDRFRQTLDKGIKEFEKGERDAFVLFTTYGFPLEMTQELAREAGEEIDVEKFRQQMKDHQELSKSGSEAKFKGGLSDHSEMSVKYHTATHLLHQALRSVLGEHVEQRGSNITPERLRFDFAHDAKLTDEEKERVESLVNEQIQAALSVTYEDVPLEEAKEMGAIGLFEEKYGDKVRVYKIGDFSLETCGGPHVENTSELGAFKIKKEEASSQGVRRIKAILE